MDDERKAWLDGFEQAAHGKPRSYNPCMIYTLARAWEHGWDYYHANQTCEGKNMKRIYLFRPHVNYSYCGGVIAVVAASYERAVELALAHPDFAGDKVGSGDYELQFMTEAQEDEQLENGVDKWVLLKDLPLQGEHEEFVFVNYNYA